MRAEAPRCKPKAHRSTWRIARAHTQCRNLELCNVLREFVGVRIALGPAQHIAAPILGSFANFFGNSSDGDGETLSQEVYDEIARASAAAAELAFEVAANQVTPQPSSRMPNPALTPLPPITPAAADARAISSINSGKWY